MKSALSFCILYVLSFFFIACEKEDISDDLGGYSLPEAMIEAPHDVSSNEVLERAYQMATMEWTPVNPVPMRGGGFYEPGLKVTGAPYSHTKVTNTYLFQDVSYYTFITAVHNPRSVLYTEDISQPPYNGLNCASYYGSVCSTSVMWALGFRIPYLTFHIVELPYMKKLEHQEPDSLKVCDVLLKSGHVQMVFDLEYRSDTLYRVKLFEQSGKSAHIRTYTKRGLKKMWDDYCYVAYRYEYVNYSTEPTVFRGFEAVVYNDDLCPSKGDKAVYRADDTININIFNHSYDSIVLIKDGKVNSVNQIDGESHQYHDLLPGIYYVYLQDKDRTSFPVSFEVIKTDIMVSYIANGKGFIVHFNSSSNADYVVLYRREGPPLYYDISDQERLSGQKAIPFWDVPEYYCKVVFRGEYGTMINRPIRVR